MPRRTQLLVTPRGVLCALMLASAAPAACLVPESEESQPSESEAEAVATASDEIIISTHTGNGQVLTVNEVGTISYLTSRIASCGDGALYASRTDGTLWHNKHGGVGSWVEVTEGTKGTKIACDHNKLYSVTASGTMYVAKTMGNGQLAETAEGSGAYWTKYASGSMLYLPTDTVDIQSGVGNIYAITQHPTTGLAAIYTSEAWDSSKGGAYQGLDLTWVQHGTSHTFTKVSGAGSRALLRSGSADYRKANRAYGLKADDTLQYNDGLLYGAGTWNGFPNGGVDLISITADEPNVLYALAMDGMFGRRLIRYNFVEDDCADGIDNDANGLIDAEDPRCRGKLATDWCQTRSGSYCIDRIENTYGYDHALVTCNGPGTQPTIKAGLCTKVSSGNDVLAADPVTAEPTGSGRYCNILMPDHSWHFEYAGSVPCTSIQFSHPGGTVVRAGLYSTTGENSVLVSCDGDVLEKFEGTGTAPLASAKASVSATNDDNCVFTVSPKQLRVFDAPFPSHVWTATDRGYYVGHVFDHIPACVEGDDGCPCRVVDCSMSLSNFNSGATGKVPQIDYRGNGILEDYNNQAAYDYVMREGTPLYAVAYGKVLPDGARKRSISGGGTGWQGEIYIQHDVGTVSTYRESFATYYGHVRRSVVVAGQTVEPGQLIGYSGNSGASSHAHLHFGVTRLTNINARKAGNIAFGWHNTQTPTNGYYGVNADSLPGLVDPYGWNPGQGFDPNGWRYAKAISAYDSSVIGGGTWSPLLWKTGQAPSYP